MKIRTTAPKRKDVVKVMEEVAGQKSMYLGPPTFAYQVGDFILDRDGVIETELTSEGMRMKMELIQKGFAADDAEETEATEEAEVTIQLPMYGHTAESIRNLLFMIHSKQYLLAKSIGEQVLKISEGLVEKLNEKKELTLEEVLDCFEKEKGNCVGIRETGLTNMFDIHMVQRLANDRNFYELVIFIEEHQKEYVNFISTGKSN